MTNTIKIISKKEYLKDNPEPVQEEVWDNISSPWKTYVVKKVSDVVAFLKDKKGKVIDLGCGTGRNMIPNKEIEYLGVDFSEGQLKRAKEYVRGEKINAKFRKLNVFDLKGVDSESFDYGLFIACLHCVEGEDKRRKALEELYRVLKKGGRVLISTWDSSDKRFDHVGNRGEVYMAWREEGISYMRYYYLYDKEELSKLIESVGFRIINFYEGSSKVGGERFSRKNWVIEVEKN